MEYLAHCILLLPQNVYFRITMKNTLVLFSNSMFCSTIKSQTLKADLRLKANSSTWDFVKIQVNHFQDRMWYGHRAFRIAKSSFRQVEKIGQAQPKLKDRNYIITSMTRILCAPWQTSPRGALWFYCFWCMTQFSIVGILSQELY